MKRLLILLLIPLLWVTSVEAAVKTLNSYSNAARTIAQDNFSTTTVYMKESGLANNTNYRIIFWDGAGVNVKTQDMKGSAVNTTAHHVFVPSNAPGSWHVVVYDSQTYSPVSYSPTDSHIVAQDTSYTGGASFNVQAGAVPEFSDVVAGVSVAGLCFGIYYKMRRRRWHTLTTG